MLEGINWKKVNGLLPVIIQEAEHGEVLMLGYMNEEALDKTLKESIVTFYSRSRQCLWTKGQTSGKTLKVQNISLDCDGDALLIKVNFDGLTCHRQTRSCFDTKVLKNESIY